jgi:hypothetical protein
MSVNADSLSVSEPERIELPWFRRERCIAATMAFENDIDNRQPSYTNPACKCLFILQPWDQPRDHGEYFSFQPIEIYTLSCFRAWVLVVAGEQHPFICLTSALVCFMGCSLSVPSSAGASLTSSVPGHRCLLVTRVIHFISVSEIIRFVTV